jgi:hypothetical protein
MAELSVHGLRRLAGAIRRLPLPIQRYTAILFSKDLTAVCRKVALR